eukprot:g23976.t1
MAQAAQWSGAGLLALARAVQWQRAMQMLQKTEVEVDIVSINVVLKAIAHGAVWRWAMQLLEDAQAYTNKK